jgi:penicillin-binding protein 1A
MPHDLTLALGTLEVTPLELASGYAVFANGGYRVQPYFIDRIEDAAGQVVWRAAPRLVCAQCDQGGATQPQAPAVLKVAARAAPATLPGGDPRALAPGESLEAAPGASAPLSAEQIAPRVITAANAYVMTDMMGDVIRHGTGVRARVLGREDIAGKTGTTNKAVDTWFNGFTDHLVATVWVGFDQDKPLGESEEWAHTALPIWIAFMREALRGVQEEHRPMPDGVVTLRISAQTGELVSDENRAGITEIFMANHLPQNEPGNMQNAESQQSGEPIF